MTPGKTAEQIAREFHRAYEAAAPRFGYETRRDTRRPWSKVPKANRDLMCETVRDLLARGIIAAGPNLH